MEFNSLTNPGSHNENGECHCNKCNPLLANNTIIQKGLQMHSKENPNKCNFCDTSFQSVQILKEHMDVHSIDKPFQSISISCEVISASHKAKEKMEPGIDETFQCSLCEKNFLCNVLFKNHMCIHTREKPIQCIICDKTFRK